MAGEFSLGCCLLLRVQAPRLSINWRTGVGEQMMADTMTRFGGGESVRREDVRKLGKLLLDTLGAVRNKVQRKTGTGLGEA